MWGALLQGSCHWQLWKNHIIHVGGSCYKVPIIDSYKVPSTCGGTPLQGSHHWQLQGSYIHIISYMWGDPITMFPSLTVTRFPHSHHIIHVGWPHYKVPAFHIRYGGTIRVIDSYRVPTVACPCPQGLGALIGHVKPLALASLSCNSEIIINGTTLFLRSRMSKWGISWLSLIWCYWYWHQSHMPPTG